MVRIIMITARAAAKGQLFPRVIWSWIRLPTSTTLFPPRISAMKNSPIDGIKVRITPDKSPGRVSLKLTVQKAFALPAPRSRAASTSDQSSFSALEYTDRIINGSNTYIIPMTIAG